MQEAPRTSGHTWSGTLRIFIAELLILPCGIATVAFLTRRLGPHDYGVLSLAATLIIWIELSVMVLYGKVTVKWVAEAEDWRPLGGVITRLHLATGFVAAAAIFVTAPYLAAALKMPELSFALRLFSLDIPLFALAQAHRQILIGLGAFTERALVGAMRWMSRMVLIIIFVSAGLSLTGAILGNIGCTVAELLLARHYVKPPLFARERGRLPDFWAYVIPLSAFSLSMRVFDKLDLFLVKLMGGSASVTGFYGAAQNLSLLPSIFTMAFVPLLISTLVRMLQHGEITQAKQLMNDAWRVVLVMLPMAAIIAGSANEIAGLFFGAEFLPAGKLLSLLVFAAIGVAGILINCSILAASAKPGWTFNLIAPVLLAAVIGYIYVIPDSGAPGAAAVTTAAAILGSLVTAIAAYRLWRIIPPVGTVLRTVLFSAAAYAAATFWPSPGVAVVIKDCVLAAGVLAAYFLSGELNSEERQALRRTVFAAKG